MSVRDWVREKRGEGQNARCGGADSFYCSAWGCETTGTVYWLTGPIKDLIQVKLPQDFPPCKTLSSKPGQCFPLQIKFTDEGKKHTRWDLGKIWGLRLYQTGFNNGFRFELRLQQGPLYSTPQLALGPNPVLSDQESPTQAKGKSRPAATPTPPYKTTLANLITSPAPVSKAALAPTPDKPPGSGDRLIHLTEGAFRALNATNPAATKACGLCLATSPPYYEGLATLGNFSNQTSPPAPGQVKTHPAKEAFQQASRQVKQ